MRKTIYGYPLHFYIAVTCISVVAVALSTAFFMWFFGWAPPVYGLEDAKTSYIAAPQQPQTEATTYYYDHDLNDAQKKAYVKIEEAMRVMADGVYLDEPLSVLETTRTCNAVVCDNPDIFWCAQNGVKYAENRSGVCMLKFAYTCSPEEATAKAASFEEKTRDALSTIGGENTTAKAKAIAQYVTDNTDYVDGDLAHSIEGVIGEGQAVCSGYSNAVKYMCDLEGIPCVYVHGYIGADPFSNHAWNEIHADGAVYSVDATWHESTDADPDWFSADTKKFRKSRTPSFAGVFDDFENVLSAGKTI